HPSPIAPGTFSSPARASHRSPPPNQTGSPHTPSEAAPRVAPHSATPPQQYAAVIPPPCTHPSRRKASRESLDALQSAHASWWKSYQARRSSRQQSAQVASSRLPFLWTQENGCASLTIRRAKLASQCPAGTASPQTRSCPARRTPCPAHPEAPNPTPQHPKPPSRQAPALPQ